MAWIGLIGINTSYTYTTKQGKETKWDGSRVYIDDNSIYNSLVYNSRISVQPRWSDTTITATLHNFNC